MKITVTGMGEADKAVCARFGRNLRHLRSLAGLTQAEVGRKLGVTLQQVQKYESGANNVSVAALCRLKAVLGCEFADLLQGLDGRSAEDVDAATAKWQSLSRRLSKSVLAIGDIGVQEELIRLARTLAARGTRGS